MHLRFRRLFVAIVALLSTGGAAALGFGPIRANVVLGQPLNLAVPVNLADGETLAAECASAEVTAGDNKMAPGSVRVRVTQGRDASESVLRISTTSAVEEPVLTVTVSAGCPMRLSRTLVLLADPPLVSVATAPTESPSLPTVTPPAAQAPTTATAAPAPTASTAPRATRPRPPPRATRTASSPPPAPRAVAAAAPTVPAEPRAAAAPRLRTMGKGEAKPRLQLDGGQISTTRNAAVAAAEEQASAARATAVAAEAAASAAGERVRQMEAEMARVRADAKAQTDALVQVRQQLALDRAQREQTSTLTMALIAIAALLMAAVVWLATRLRKQASAPRNSAEWWDRGRSAEMSPVAPPPTASQFLPSQLPPTMQRESTVAAAWSDTPESRQGVDSMIAPMTMPAPTSVTIPALAAAVAPAEDESTRAMSVDEQIDLEQQADFFIALGHDDAAIDLLMAHMRSTGGGSPLPFLKLLEIHRRRDQREAYERTRVRFNQRFNSVAPEWQGDPKGGRTLDEYPLAMGRIQRAWPSPLDAMAELEALLFRRGPGAELFDLPAYQELLFLYQMARDLHDADDTGATDVDVLLPIGGRSAPMPVAPGTIVLRPEFNAGEPVSLDLDLTTRTGDILEPPALDKPIPLSLEKPEKEPPAAADDFWADDPDARPTR